MSAIDQFARVPEALLAVKDGRVDGHVNDDVVIAVVKDNPDLKAVGKPLVPRPFGIAVRKGEPHLRPSRFCAMLLAALNEPILGT